eukprot:TRINITY_DN20681_c0_g1_i1.p1 TRINITY_DN20681_c0_g1~~TRINITY_DN20681_c0_g1_i1.p1  ORF type:complete len:167 (-),score=19.24 TRINITY_DN20681_c0_g1_i1:99-599(-)
MVETTLIEHEKFKIIIMGSPDNINAGEYVDVLKTRGVTDLVRTCEPSYEAGHFEEQGIHVHELQFPDGAAPSDDVLQRWVELLVRRYRSSDPKDSGLVAVHCLAGLGRAPVMAAIALVEMTNLDPFGAVEKIRERQQGAINKRQLQFLQAYKRITKKDSGVCCVIS